MSHQIQNQYRFNLESKNRTTIKYEINIANSNIIFNNDSFSTNTSNVLNKFIGYCLSTNSNVTYGSHTDSTMISRIANIKCKIPCVGYFNSNNIEPTILPEFFIKNFKPSLSHGLTAFNPDIRSDSITELKSTFDMESNLYVNCNLHVSDDITAFATYHSSDINLKKNINTLTNCYDIVSDLNPVGFKWIKDNKDNVGFIAQEVEQIIPSIVSDTDEYKAIAETKIIAYLVGAIQELDKELKELENE